MKLKFSHIFGLFVLVSLFFLPTFAKADAFYRNLKQGDKGSDVLRLQQILNSNPNTQVTASGAGSLGSETTFFGPATKRAVIAFQELYRDEILVPSGLTQGNGFVGAMTRKKLNSIVAAMPGVSTATSTTKAPSVSLPTGGVNQSFISNAPVITSLGSNIIQNGEKIIIYGRNFQPKNTVLVSIELPGKYANVPAISSTSTEIVFSSTIAEDFKKSLSKLNADAKKIVLEKVQTQMSKDSAYKDGWYMAATVSIKNEYGVSNALPVKINILKGI